MSTPDWNLWLAGAWGPPSEQFPADFGSVISTASNVVIGNNPPYQIQDFLALFPKFGGTPLLSGAQSPLATFGAGASNMTVNNPAGMAAGQPIAGNGIADGTFITSVVGTSNNATVNINTVTTASGNSVPLTVWNAFIVPLPVLQIYITLASACLIQARWLDYWTFAMGLFIAHYASLYAKSDGNPNSNVTQVAAQGLSTGIMIAKTVGDVSASFSPVGGIEEWGAWNLTIYGQQLATIAKIIGMGPMMAY